MTHRSRLLVWCALLLLGAGSEVLADGTPKVRSSKEAAALVAVGRAVLVDVREADVVEMSMVAAPAYTLPFSDLRGERKQWQAFLEANRDREIIVYDTTGKVSAQAVTILTAEGFSASSAGLLLDWRMAELPVRDSDEPRR